MMSCLGDCLELGPPPDTILFLPPPPAPSFLQLRSILDNVTSPCAAQLCEWGGAVLGGQSGAAGVPAGVAKPQDTPTRPQFVDVGQREVEGGQREGDTWLFVLVASSIGVLFLGALLALFLLKCREEHRAQSKHLEQRQLPTTKPRLPSSQGDLGDNRMLWAALTPRGGTQHYVAGAGQWRAGPPPPVPPPPHPHLLHEPEYETIGEHYASNAAYQRYGKIASFDNSGFSEYEYEYCEPVSRLSQSAGAGGYGEQQDMRCVSGARRLATPPRPRVSPPTRIEHPNLPPLNLNPSARLTSPPSYHAN